MITKEQVGTVLEQIYKAEIPIRLEWVYDGGFTWSLIDAEKFPRVWYDDGFMDREKILTQAVEHARASDKAQFLAPDWLERGSSDTIEGAVSDLLVAIQQRWPEWQ